MLMILSAISETINECQFDGLKGEAALNRAIDKFYEGERGPCVQALDHYRLRLGELLVTLSKVKPAGEVVDIPRVVGRAVLLEGVSRDNPHAQAAKQLGLA